MQLFTKFRRNGDRHSKVNRKIKVIIADRALPLCFSEFTGLNKMSSTPEQMHNWNIALQLQMRPSLFDWYHFGALLSPHELKVYLGRNQERGERCLGGSSRFERKIGAIHQTQHLTNAKASQSNKGFIYEAANRETCEVQGLLRVYQSASQLLYLTSGGQRPRGPHSIFWLVGLGVFSCKRKKRMWVGKKGQEGIRVGDW